MSSFSSSPAPMISRNAAIAGGVVAFHVAALWAIQSGLLQRAVEIIVPVAIMSEFIEPPRPKVEPPPPPVPPTPVKRTITKAPTLPPPPMPVAIPDPTPAPNAPTGSLEPQPPAPPIAAPVVVAAAPAAAPAAPPAPVRVELPSSNADYLQNPKPAYPYMSKRLGEQGKTTINVLIGIDGLPKEAKIKQSSGFERLDQAALETVMRWRYVPGKRAGVAVPMAFDVPINWVLN